VAAAALAARIKEINSPLIKAIRIGRPTAGVTRVVLELAGAPRYSAFPLYGPFRLVVDLEATTPPPSPPPAPPQITVVPPPVHSPPAATSAAAERSAERNVERNVEPSGPTPTPVRSVTTPPMPPPLAVSPGLPSITSKGDYSLARQLGLSISRIVIDAGHGGHDPGAQANGINESELVLDVSLRLEKLLAQRPGFDVVLTRKTDEFIPLEERTAIANREGADLFLSIHANASKQPIAHGIETYILNFATNPAAEAVAARENATSAQTMGTLPAILKAIALNNKLAESRELATILQTSMIRKLRVQNKTLKDLGVKQAPFVVLIGAQMPSVLAEISFVTNKPEASLLKQAAYRQQIAEALCDAIVKYQNSLKKITTSPSPSAKATK
jgi:N-acetylmuramoyl-L-alanine amidase